MKPEELTDEEIEKWSACKDEKTRTLLHNEWVTRTWWPITSEDMEKIWESCWEKGLPNHGALMSMVSARVNKLLKKRGLVSNRPRT